MPVSRLMRNVSKMPMVTTISSVIDILVKMTAKGLGCAIVTNKEGELAGIITLEHALETAFALLDISNQAGIALIYKSSFDNANRSSLSSWRGAGIKEGLTILAEVRKKTSVPVITDSHDHCCLKMWI